MIRAPQKFAFVLFVLTVAAAIPAYADLIKCDDGYQTAGSAHSSKFELGDNIGRGNAGEVRFLQPLDAEGNPIPDVRLGAKTLLKQDDAETQKINEAIFENEFDILKEIYPETIPGYGPAVQKIVGPDGRTYITFPLFENQAPPTFESILKRRSEREKIPAEKAKQLRDAFLESIAELHAKGIIHGDIKTANAVFIDKDGVIRAKQIDVGLANRADRPNPNAIGKGFGTPVNLDFESYFGKEITFRRDVAGAEKTFLRDFPTSAFNDAQRAYMRLHISESAKQLQERLAEAEKNPETFPAKIAEYFSARVKSMDKAAAQTPDAGMKEYREAQIKYNLMNLILMGKDAKAIIAALKTTDRDLYDRVHTMAYQGGRWISESERNLANRQTASPHPFGAKYGEATGLVSDPACQSKVREFMSLFNHAPKDF